MANRKTKFAVGEYYHIYNRGTDKRKVFMDNADCQRFVESILLMNDEKDGMMICWRDFKKAHPETNLQDFLKSNFRKPLVVFNAYCLNQNHTHFILRQESEKGIEKFMQRLGTGYTKYFNKKHGRSGVLFQGAFKSVHIDNNDYLLYLSAYVNMNHFVHGYQDEQPEKIWPYSSMPIYMGKRNDIKCDTSVILSQFKNAPDYEKFAKENALYI